MIKILAVEDEAVSRDALVSRLRNILGTEGIIEPAEDGNQAIRKAVDMKPQLILMDIEMPFMNGLEAAAVIRRHLPETVIIFLTAYDSFDYAVTALRLGITDYLLKPVSEQDLRQLLQRLFDVAPSEKAAEAKSPFASSVRVWMEHHYTENVSLEDASTSMGMSPAYFSRKVKAEMGKTFLEQLTEFRVEEAKKRLRTTSMTVSEIGRSIGYPDSNYFVKVFKRSTGMTPTEYRAGGAS